MGKLNKQRCECEGLLATSQPGVFKEKMRREKYILAVELGLHASSSNKCSEPWPSIRYVLGAELGVFSKLLLSFSLLICDKPHELLAALKVDRWACSLLGEVSLSAGLQDTVSHLALSCNS